jgi:hypothetical protein
MSPELTEDLLRELANTAHMAQVVCLTIDGVKVMLLGPVLHVPTAGIYVGNVQEIEFGELVPAPLAARMLDGGFSKSMGMQ